MPHQNQRVLIVDDDIVYRFAAVKTIQSTGLSPEIAECNDGLEAINYIAEHLTDPEKLPDIIFLDLNMPIMDGWEFLKAFKAFSSRISKIIQIYIATSSVDQKDMLRSKEFEIVSAYIVKPVLKETILQILNAVNV